MFEVPNVIVPGGAETTNEVPKLTLPWLVKK